MSKKKIDRAFHAEAKAMILEQADAMYHALGCGGCELRYEALLVLAMVGWSEADFVTAEMKARA